MFTQGTAASPGLNATDLAVRPGHLKRLAALRGEGRKPRLKGNKIQRNDAMTKSAAEKVELLRKSVAEIVASDAADKDELLKNTFDEYEADLAEEEVAEADEADEADEEEVDPLSAFAMALGSADQSAAAMIEGEEVDETTASLLAQWSALGDLVLRSVVNNHVYSVDEDEDVLEEEAAKADGISYLELPLAKSDDGEPMMALCKTQLPEELAKLATSPEDMEDSVLAITAGLAEILGLDLAKAFPPKDPNAAAPAAPAAPQPGAGAPPAPGAAPGAAAGGSPDLGSQIQVMMRLMAAGLMQGEAILNTIGGGDADVGNPEDAAADDESLDEGMGDEEGAEEGEEEGGDAAPDQQAGDTRTAPQQPAVAQDQAKPKPASGGDAAPAKEEGGDSAPADGGEKKKNPFAKSEEAEDLKKMFTDALTEATGPLQAALADAKRQIAELQARPAAPKASTMYLININV